MHGCRRWWCSKISVPAVSHFLIDLGTLVDQHLDAFVIAPSRRVMDCSHACSVSLVDFVEEGVWLSEKIEELEIFRS